jgi:ribokinase
VSEVVGEVVGEAEGEVVSLGSINADHCVRAARLPEGSGTLLAGDLLRTSGGKAANVAVLARRLGTPSRLVGCVGDDDLAELALAGPRREGVDVGAVRRAPGPTGSSSIVVAPDGDKTIVLALNANDAWPAAVDQPEHAGLVDHIEQAVVTAPPGSVLAVDLEVPPVNVAVAARAARRVGMAVVVDPAPAERLDDELLDLADHLTPDHHEALALTGIDTRSRSGACRAAEALHRRGVPHVYVKLLGGGCVVAGAGGTVVVEPPGHLQVVDTTGAGDAFAGGLAWALSRGAGGGEAAPIAVAASACAVGTYGSQESYPSPDALAAMVARTTAANR